MPRAFHLLILAGAACALPLSASGHGSEFLQAKLTLCREGGCRLEVTADFGQNPMFQDENQARSAIADALLILPAADGGQPRLLATPAFERRTRFDPSAPPFMPDDELKQQHQLVAGVWRLHPETSSIQFEIAPGPGHDTLLWLVDERQPGEKTKWVTLLPGDRSPVIGVPPSRSTRSAWLATVVAGTCLGAFMLRRRVSAAAH